METRFPFEGPGKGSSKKSERLLAHVAILPLASPCVLTDRSVSREEMVSSVPAELFSSCLTAAAARRSLS